jgi:Protein of unknown function (DUF4238)
MSNDHTVPQMYLRRFGWQRRRSSREWFISARRVEQLDQPFTANIRNVAAVTDFYGEKVEKLLCKIEGNAKGVFDTILEDPRAALPGPDRWPLPGHDRELLAWWIAAQIVRTVRQRRRLQHFAGDGTDQLTVPQSIKSEAGRSEHLRFMADQLARLSWVVFDRPWGLGFSDLCLWTSDVPVMIMNGQDDENQLLATAYWDVVMPLDPHRFLLLPGWPAREEDPYKRADHLFKLPGGLGLLINNLAFDTADSHLFCNQDHDPFPHLRLDGPRLPTPWAGNTREGASYLLEYATMPSDLNIERRWLSEHAPPRRQSAAGA